MRKIKKIPLFFIAAFIIFLTPANSFALRSNSASNKFEDFLNENIDKNGNKKSWLKRNSRIITIAAIGIGATAIRNALSSDKGGRRVVSVIRGAGGAITLGKKKKLTEENIYSNYFYKGDNKINSIKNRNNNSENSYEDEGDENNVFVKIKPSKKTSETNFVQNAENSNGVWFANAKIYDSEFYKAPVF